MYKGIAISGKMGAGKTYLARAISKEWKIPVRSFAAALKADVDHALYEAGLNYAEGLIVEQNKPLLRGMLQDWGVIFRKLNGEDHWVNRLFEANKTPFVIDDMRFKNEFEACQARGIFTVRLDVTEQTRLRRLGIRGIQNTTHISETDLDTWDSRFDMVIPWNVTQTDDAVPYFFEQAKRFAWDIPAPKPPRNRSLAL